MCFGEEEICLGETNLLNISPPDIYWADIGDIGSLSYHDSLVSSFFLSKCRSEFPGQSKVGTWKSALFSLISETKRKFLNIIN